MPNAPTITCDFDEEELDWLNDMRAKYPKIVNAHQGGVAKWFRARMQKAFDAGGGVYGVPKFAPRAGVTNFLHGRRWGGSFPSSTLIKAWKRGGAKNPKQFFGFPDRNKLAVLFGTALQSAEVRAWEMKERRYFHWRKVPDILHPQYNRPERPFVVPFARENFLQFYKEIKSRVDKTTESEEKIQEFEAKLREKEMKRAARAKGRKRRRR